VSDWSGIEIVLRVRMLLVCGTEESGWNVESAGSTRMVEETPVEGISEELGVSNFG